MKKKIGLFILVFIMLSLLLSALVIRANKLYKTTDIIENIANEPPLTSPSPDIISQWEGEWAFYPEGHEPIYILVEKNESGKLIGAGDGWIIVMSVSNTDYANAVIQHGDEAWAGALIPGVMTPLGNLWATIERIE